MPSRLAPASAFRLPSSDRASLRRRPPAGYRPEASGSVPIVGWLVAPITATPATSPSRVRGSSNAVKRSTARTATSTATVIKRNSACMSGKVLVGNRVQQHPAQAGIIEHVLYEHSPADNETQRYAEPGQVGHDRVPTGVVPHDFPLPDTFGARHAHVILGDHGDRIIAHRQRPPAERSEDDGNGRENGMRAGRSSINVLLRLGNERGVVAATDREPIERHPEQQDGQQGKPEIRESRTGSRIVAGSILSILPPRNQALTSPIRVPKMNVTTVVTPTRPSVQGSA